MMVNQDVLFEALAEAFYPGRADQSRLLSEEVADWHARMTAPPCVLVPGVTRVRVSPEGETPFEGVYVGGEHPPFMLNVRPDGQHSAFSWPFECVEAIAVECELCDEPGATVQPNGIIACDECVPEKESDQVLDGVGVIPPQEDIATPRELANGGIIHPHPYNIAANAGCDGFPMPRKNGKTDLLMEMLAPIAPEDRTTGALREIVAAFDDCTEARTATNKPDGWRLTSQQNRLRHALMLGRDIVRHSS